MKKPCMILYSTDAYRNFQETTIMPPRCEMCSTHFKHTEMFNVRIVYWNYLISTSYVSWISMCDDCYKDNMEHKNRQELMSFVPLLIMKGMDVKTEIHKDIGEDDVEKLYEFADGHGRENRHRRYSFYGSLISKDDWYHYLNQARRYEFNAKA